MATQNTKPSKTRIAIEQNAQDLQNHISATIARKDKFLTEIKQPGYKPTVQTMGQMAEHFIAVGDAFTQYGKYLADVFEKSITKPRSKNKG